ncbi:adhesion G protein-coupled receptor G3 isoform X10 [Egretta garzetta]|uniref:adhesion G protein-coupled receptor G3 isoform X10 n=1 Tax=Egretta garzetta TaxID=188379 RepID=UPI00163CB0EC|nr:adhesion G protein-coupled receptor G3 isoform X10 [Egretta garzetta]
MSRLLGTILLLLVLPDAAGGQESCAGLQRGDSQNHCCKMEVLEEPGNWTPSPDLPQHCPELGRSGRPACACLRERWLRLLQSAGPALRGGLAGLKVLLLNVSRAVTQDVLITFSPTEGPRMLNTMEKGKAGKIQLPRELFRSLSSQRVRVVVMVLNTQQLGMFKEANQTGQVLDDTVVGIMVGKTSISGLQDPVRLTFAHGQLPHGITPQCVFWDPSKGQAGGWRNTGCVMQPGDKGTVCSCDHLTFFTLLLVTILLPTALAHTLAVLPHLGGPSESSSGQVHSKRLDGCCHCGLLGGHGFLHLHHHLLHLLKVSLLSWWGWQEPLAATDHTGSRLGSTRCWITSKHVLVHYITNCGYFGLIFLFNMAIFGVVTWKSCYLQGMGAAQGGHKAWKVALVAVGLFCLLGATWALAFLTYSTSSAPILYLFTILNSLQGIFIFIWLVALYYPKTKEATGSLSHIIRHDKTTMAS